MLTSIQIKKLRALTTSQKFGKLIEDAIETWTNKADFVFGTFGLTNSWKEGIGNFEVDPTNGNKCCLIGAALVGKEKCNNEWIYCGTKKFFNLNRNDAEKIWEGFDCNNPNIVSGYQDNEFFMFGYKVRKILLNEDE